MKKATLLFLLAAVFTGLVSGCDQANKTPRMGIMISPPFSYNWIVPPDAKGSDAFIVIYSDTIQASQSDRYGVGFSNDGGYTYSYKDKNYPAKIGEVYIVDEGKVLHVTTTKELGIDITNVSDDFMSSYLTQFVDKMVRENVKIEDEKE